MISGAHVIIYTKDPAADRTFFTSVLGFPHVDAGHGWLIFAMPTAEAAFIPPTITPATSSISCASPSTKPRCT
jgi:catechol 2,3-dioxygenase-like lactoylglutathione lyase family enzyme